MSVRHSGREDKNRGEWGDGLSLSALIVLLAVIPVSSKGDPSLQTGSAQHGCGCCCCCSEQRPTSSSRKRWPSPKKGSSPAPPTERQRPLCWGVILAWRNRSRARQRRCPWSNLDGPTCSAGLARPHPLACSRREAAPPSIQRLGCHKLREDPSCCQPSCWQPFGSGRSAAEQRAVEHARQQPFPGRSFRLGEMEACHVSRATLDPRSRRQQLLSHFWTGLP